MHFVECYPVKGLLSLKASGRVKVCNLSRMGRPKCTWPSSGRVECTRSDAMGRSNHRVEWILFMQKIEPHGPSLLFLIIIWAQAHITYSQFLVEEGFCPLLGF